MAKQLILSQRLNLILAAVLAGFILATLSCRLEGAAEPAYNLFGRVAWWALESFRPVLLLAGRQASLGRIGTDSAVLRDLLHIGACTWPLLRSLAV